MTTTNSYTEETGIGTIIGLVVAVIVIALLFIYGIPALRARTAEVPATATTSVSEQFPDAGTVNATTTVSSSTSTAR